MNKIRDWATRAVRAAADTRRKARVARDGPICIFDLAERLEVEVRFVDAPSLEGMYSHSENGTILLPSLQHRPPGRLTFSCAHELGHHIFGHGTRVDEYLRTRPENRVKDEEEWLADCFAGYLLMPRSAVTEGFARRGVSIENSTELDAYVVACELGVGYQTLVSHSHLSLKLLSAEKASVLRKWTPKRIRAHFLPGSSYPHLTVVDMHWPASSVSVDLRCGDAAVFPVGTRIDGHSARVSATTSSFVVVDAVKVGRSRAILPDDEQAIFIRVAKAGFVGRSIFRHLEDPDEYC